MYYGHLNALGRNFMGSRIDPDGAAYVAAVVVAGGTVDATQASAVDTFYKSAKADGYYTSLKRLYLPIWGVAAANAIDMITLASGTFVGGVTHSAGYVQGNGTTGYFDFGKTFTELGTSLTNAYFGSLLYEAPSAGFRGLVGNGAGLTSEDLYFDNSGDLVCRWKDNGTGYRGATARVGIFSASITASQNRSTYKRLSAGKSTVATSAAIQTGSPAAGNVNAMSVANANFSDAKIGSYFVGLGLSNANDTAFTLALKTMWETTSSLLLP